VATVTGDDDDDIDDDGDDHSDENSDNGMEMVMISMVKRSEQLPEQISISTTGFAFLSIPRRTPHFLTLPQSFFQINSWAGERRELG